ncbi:MAG: sporadic carbohydrate cluster protein, TIGR04323 family [Alphaproteobacteria bacterium]|nr:sporadic carbohydrate cluster protein, TIGR04323 family [Alphaproteobacteria bacterium]
MTASNRQGYRGYICARMEMGRSTPQHIQQLVIRDYCAKRGMRFLLSATEYCMPGCTLILDAVLAELNALDGIVMYSLYQMPTDKQKRMAMYVALFASGCELHCAAENIAIRSWDDANRIEDVWLVAAVMEGQSQEAFTALKQFDRHCEGV